MILADKIIRLRKKNGWSQEELAEKMQVSRQAVSKWESAQSVPDLAKILMLSSLFGVSTDYLLRDELEEEPAEEPAEPSEFPAVPVRRVSMEEANAYLEQRGRAARRIAAATFLCMLAPLCLIALGAAADLGAAHISETFAGAVGLTVLLVLVAAAVAVFVYTGSQNSPYEYLQKEPFETEYGVSGMVEARRKEFRDVYTRSNLLGVVICILSPLPLLVGAFSGSELLVVLLLCVTIVLAGIGVIFFITAGVRWESMRVLLQEGEYSRREKQSGGSRDAVSRVYWPVVTAAYLAWSFLGDAWRISWVIWPVAAVLFGAIAAICSVAEKRK